MKGEGCLIQVAGGKIAAVSGPVPVLNDLETLMNRASSFFKLEILAEQNRLDGPARLCECSTGGMFHAGFSEAAPKPKRFGGSQTQRGRVLDVSRVRCRCTRR